MTAASSFDANGAWALDERVALRPESFGALAYHFGTRRLSILKSRRLVEVVRTLGDHRTASDAFRAVGLSATEQSGVLRALDQLARTQMIVQRNAR